MTRARDIADSTKTLSVDGGTIKLDGNYPVGTGNTALGDSALDDGSLSGNNNIAIGGSSLTANTSGTGNVAVGQSAAGVNTTGSSNSVLGNAALLFNQSGSNNVSVGETALYSNTTANNNTAVGYQALYSQTTAQGGYNTAVGYQAGYTGNGYYNTHIGYTAGLISTGYRGTFIGHGAGNAITTGNGNTIIGTYNGNSGGLDIRTLSNYIVLSDGDGNPRVQINSNGLMNVKPTTGDVIFATSPHGGNTSNSLFVGFNTSALAFNVTTNGNVTNLNNSYGAISDVKLKENIIDASSQWDDIKALTVRKYSMKADSLDAPNMLGVIAQEVEAAGMGGLVIESPDKTLDGGTLDTTTKTVNYSIIYMKAVKALQEAMDRIETLEAKVTALENA